jgi:hypothetical protein
VVYWDADARKDLLIGQADGKVKVFSNVGTDPSPVFDSGSFLQVGPIGSKVDIDVGNRATLDVTDWDNDGVRDLIAGAYDGKIHLYINKGTDSSPHYVSETFAQEDGSDLIVPSVRSSPVVLDVNGDGAKDIVSGNTNGQLLQYLNVGSAEAPSFSGYNYLQSGGVDIDLNSLGRSRPFVCDWTGDGKVDVLIGVGDGQVHLYQGRTYVPAVTSLGVVAVILLLAALGMKIAGSKFGDRQKN